MLCKTCERIEKGNELNIYEDKEVIAFLEEKPEILGQITLSPKKHFPILEQLPDKSPIPFSFVNICFPIVQNLDLL